MKSFVFPGQGAQFQGMGKDLYTDHIASRKIFDQADDILGYKLSEVMFEGSDDDLKETKITQPALFVHAIAKLQTLTGEFEPAAVAGHSLGEFSALVAAKALSFEDGLKLVYERAMAMQDACELNPGTMAAVLGLEDHLVEEVCASIENETVVPANYNCPGQLVISGSLKGIELAVQALKDAGAKRALVLPVGGAFHSPLMDSAKERLASAIESAIIKTPICPIYQNVVAAPVTDPVQIKINLINQLTGSVKWTQSIQQMIADGMTEFVEVGGSGKVLSGLILKINRTILTSSL
ncbi:MAG: ACP S-malonyltransferase [Saprospiraceae bacterium]|nr:ACP S-malonyltransferase [Saprospiraceae bacterium]MBK8634322.1 ACP S-malonyltransferase [Saprospiraceae bacterium]